MRTMGVVCMALVVLFVAASAQASLSNPSAGVGVLSGSGYGGGGYVPTATGSWVILTGLEFGGGFHTIATDGAVPVNVGIAFYSNTYGGETMNGISGTPLPLLAGNMEAYTNPLQIWGKDMAALSPYSVVLASTGNDGDTNAHFTLATSSGTGGGQRLAPVNTVLNAATSYTGAGTYMIWTGLTADTWTIKADQYHSRPRYVQVFSEVPEPATMALLGLGGLGLLLRRKRR